MSAVSFRPAREDDVSALALNRWRLRVEDDGEPEGVSTTDFYAHCEHFLREALRSRSWALFVGEGEHRLVANAFVQIVPTVPRPHRFDDALGYLTNVYVDPEWRGRGVGTALLQHVLARARERDLDLLVVWPSARSQGLYARLGFGSAQVRELVLRPE